MQMLCIDFVQNNVYLIFNLSNGVRLMIPLLREGGGWGAGTSYLSIFFFFFCCVILWSPWNQWSKINVFVLFCSLLRILKILFFLLKMFLLCKLVNFTLAACYDILINDPFTMLSLGTISKVVLWYSSSLHNNKKTIARCQELINGQK